MIPISKALKLRESLSRTSQNTLDRFYNILSEPKKLLEFIEDKTQRKELIQEARKNYIVALATAFEVFWREFIREAVDSTDIKKAKLSKRKFSFNEITEILGHKLTLGELVASIENYQGIEPLQEVSQEIFGFDFLGCLSKDEIEVFENDEPVLKIKGEEILKGKTYIEQGFEMRHQIVHDAGSGLNISKNQVNKIERFMGLFCIFGAINWQRNIPNKLENSVT
jgi:hypothetical protein